MQVLKHNINQKLYEGEFILITEAQSLDRVVYDYYKDIKLDGITGQSWTAYSDIFTLVLELNPHIQELGEDIKEGATLFMPAPLTKSADGRIKLWD